MEMVTEGLMEGTAKAKVRHHRAAQDAVSEVRLDLGTLRTQTENYRVKKMISGVGWSGRRS